jgi:hypothetical protein
MAKSLRSKLYLCIVLMSFAAIAALASPAMPQSEETEGRMIAPRRFPQSFWNAKKAREEKRRAIEQGQVVPFQQEAPLLQAATDVLGITTSFAGLAFPNSGGSVPPDTHVATGPTHIVEVTNTTVAFYSRAQHKRLFLQDLGAFFASGEIPNTFLTDPVVIYDDIVERFVIAMIDVDFTLARGFLLYAVSDTSNPLHGFSEMHQLNLTEQGIALNETVLPDFTRIGWNADAHVIALNMFGATSLDFDHVSVITIDKSTALDASPATLAFTHTDRDDSHFTMAPAAMYGSVAGDPMYFVEEAGYANGAAIRVVKMTNVLDPSPSFSDTDVSVDAYEFPFNADQPGSGGLGSIQTNDARIISVAWRDNRLVAAHNVTIPSTFDSRARWYEFDTTSSPALTQHGIINPGSGIHTYYPSVAVAVNGDIGMTFMQSSAIQFISMYVTGQNSADVSGQMRTPVLAKAGQRTYRAFDCAVGSFILAPCRAGDYSGISIDPNFSNLFCAANQYATGASFNNWGTWVACFAIGAHDLAVTGIVAPATVTGGIAGVIKPVTVTIQNRSNHSETITPADLGDGISSGLVRLTVQHIDDDGEGCAVNPVVALNTAKNAGLFGSTGSKILPTKRKMTINYLVTFQCTNALPSNTADPTRGDYSYTATVHHDELDGSADIHSEDDACPRDALPGNIDPLPPPSGISDKGCGAKKPDGTLGNPVVTNVVP